MMLAVLSLCYVQLAVGHHPTYSNGEHGNNTDLIQHVEPLLLQYNVAAYFVGERL